jgi:hypothetical protein
MTLQPNLLPRLLGLVLQPDPLKLGSCKFHIIIIINFINITIDIIINIINITLESGVAVRAKALIYNFAEIRNILSILYFPAHKFSILNILYLLIIFLSNFPAREKANEVEEYKKDTSILQKLSLDYNLFNVFSS